MHHIVIPSEKNCIIDYEYYNVGFREHFQQDGLIILHCTHYNVLKLGNSQCSIKIIQTCYIHFASKIPNISNNLDINVYQDDIIKF